MQALLSTSEIQVLECPAVGGASRSHAANVFLRGGCWLDCWLLMAAGRGTSLAFLLHLQLLTGVVGTACNLRKGIILAHRMITQLRNNSPREFRSYQYA